MQKYLKVLGIFLIAQKVLTFTLYESSGDEIWTDIEIEDNAFDKPTLPEAECVWGSECDLTCKRINGTRASQYINEALNDEETICEDIRTLHVTESEYVTFNVNKGWLNRVKAQIDFLTISNSDIKYIEDEAFKSPALTYTQHLNLEGLLIDIFHVETFQNLPALTRLKIANLTELKIIRPLTLESVSATLVRLEIRNILASFWNSQGLNFIGSVPMPVLRELFLVNNDLSNKITNSAFKNLTALTSLQLTTSGITSLPVDVFENLSPTVNSIRLDGNLLQSVPEGIFDGPIARNSNVKINLSGNRWHCHCENLHLQELIRENLNIFNTVVECSYDGDTIKHKIVDVEIDCTTIGTTEETTQSEEEETSEPTTENKTDKETTIDQETDEPETTEDPTTVGTEQQPPIFTTHEPVFSSNPTSTTQQETTIAQSPTPSSKSSQPSTEPTSTMYYLSPLLIDCTSRSYFSEGRYDDVNAARGSTIPTAPTIPYKPSQITLERAMIDFSIKTVALNKIELKFDVSNFVTSMAVLYYDASLDHTEYTNMLQKSVKCADVSTTREAYISNLIPGVTYTICYCGILNNMFYFNTPFNCKTHYMPLPRAEQPWLYQNQKVLIISVVFLIVLITLIAGVVATYFMIRRMPTLLRGSKRVVMVNNRTKDVMVMPEKRQSKQNAYQKDFSSCCKDEQQANYMTPVARQPMQRPSLHRSCSDTSLNSARSYMTVSPPRFSNVFQQAEFCCDVAKRSGSYPCSVPPAIPPPLPPYPPNHRRSIASNASTAEISKVSRHRSVYDDRRRGNKHQHNVYEDATENHYNFII